MPIATLDALLENIQVNQPEPQPKSDSQEEISVLMEYLSESCERAKEDFRNYEHPAYSTRPKENKQIRRDQADYLDRRVQLQAFEIYETIQGLIRHHAYPKEMWGDYELLFESIKESSPENAVLELQKLVIIASQVIPHSVKYQQIEIVESAITSHTRTQEE
jgi:hypothetical protein